MPNKRTGFFIFVLAVVAVLLGLNRIYQPFLQPSDSALTQGEPSPVPATTDELSSNLDLTAFTPRQKVTWLLAVPLSVVEDQPLSASSSAWLAENRPGAITLFGSRLSSQFVTSQISALEEKLGNEMKPRPLIAVDHEGGQVQRLSGPGFTTLPSWQNLCAQPATRSAQLLQTSAQEIRAAGIDLVFAPMTDLASNHPTLRTRVCDDDPKVVITKTQEYIDAMGRANVMPVIKHFPGIGQTTRDLHFQFDSVTVTTDEAMIYQTLLNEYPGIGVMVSHVGVTNQFSDVPCSLSLDCVGQIAANFPQSLVVSDALEMKAAGYQSGTTESLSLPIIAEKAVRAGEQLLVFGPQVSLAELNEVIDHLEAKYTTDAVFKAQVDRAITRLDQVPNL